MDLGHYYHLYSQGIWQEAWKEHITALIDSSLYEHLDFIKIGMVGDKQSREYAIDIVKQHNKVEIAAESDSGFEQVTHDVIEQDIKSPGKSFKVLYCHSKGAANHRHDQDNWRREMTNGTVYHWKECVDLLDQYDAIGCRYRASPFRHLSGNFWWATSSYLSTLAQISYTYRDDAEAWIGQGSKGGTLVEIDPSFPDLNVTPHSFGRIFVCKRDRYGHTFSNLGDIGQPILGDEFVGFPSTEGSRIIAHLMTNGATCSIIGNTIIVKSV